VGAVRLHPGSREKSARIRNRLRQRQLEASGCQHEPGAIEFSADASEKRRMLVIICVTRWLAHPRDIVKLCQIR
jgi:hypothetical protein